MARRSRHRHQLAVRRQITTAVSSPSAGRNRASLTFYIWTIWFGLFAEQHEVNLRYSFPAVVIKSIWNLAFVVVTVVTLILSLHEKPKHPFRVWISVYSLIHVVRVLALWLEYTKRNTRTPSNNIVISTLIRYLGQLGAIYSLIHVVRVLALWLEYTKRNTRTPSNNIVISTLIRSSTILETLNIAFSQIWLWFGGCCIYRKSEIPPPDAPRLFWLTVACVFSGLGLLYIRSLQFFSNSIFLFTKKGASDADISMLPKYRFEVSNDENRANGRACRMVPMLTNGPEFSAERALLVQDADCCICLCNYEDGAELYSLPCNHHFHTSCIRQWLMLRARCPLCNRGMIRKEAYMEQLKKLHFK